MIMLSKKFVQKTTLFSFTTIGFLVFSFNQKSFCMEREEEERSKVSSTTYSSQGNSNLLSIINSLKESDLKKAEEIRKLLKKNQELETIIKKQEQLVLNNSSLRQPPSEKEKKLVIRKEKTETSIKSEEEGLINVYLKNVQLEKEIEELIEERNNLYSLTADPDGTHKIIQEMMQLIGIKTDDLINCEGIIFAEKCLGRLKAVVDSAGGEGKQDDFPAAFNITSSSSYPSNSVGEIEVVKPVSITTPSTTFSFDTWRQGLLSIKAPWAKVIWQRWTHNNLQSLDLYHNQIDSEGGKRLGEALSNTSLLYLNLANNWLGDEGATAIGKALEVNTTLLKLNFNLNKIGNKGAKALGESLKFNTTLQFMSLRYNKFNAEGKAVIIKNAHCKVDFKS